MSTSEARPSRTDPGRRRAKARPAGRSALALAAAAVVAGCSTSLPPAARNAPVLSVVTGLYPLAQIAQEVGGPKVSVDDVVPSGTDPLRWTATASSHAAIGAAGLVVQIGGGFQPGFEAASAGAPRVLSLRSALPTGSPYLWLDPTTTTEVVTAVAGAMAAADPAAAALFRSNAEAVDAQVRSLGIDYSSTLSACPGSTIVTPDRALSTMAASYGLHDLVVPGGSSGAMVDDTVGAVRRSPPAAVVSQPWVDNSGVAAVARAARVRLRPVDTLTGAPTGGWPRGSTYFSLMEQNLGVISSGLGCPNEQ